MAKLEERFINKQSLAFLPRYKDVTSDCHGSTVRIIGGRDRRAIRRFLFQAVFT
jgi:hypothetical protein